MKMLGTYVSPAFKVLDLNFEGILCTSDTETEIGGGGGGYEPDPDYPGGIC